MPRESAQQRDAREHFEAMAARRLKRLTKLKTELAKRTVVESAQDCITAETARYEAAKAAAAAIAANPVLPESAGDAWRKSVGLPPGDSRASNATKPAERYQPPRADIAIPGTSSPSGRPEHYLDHQNRILATIEGFQTGSFQNHPSPQQMREQANQAANRERIHEIFKRTAYACEWLPSGKILYDCREWTPEAWERIVLPTLQGHCSNGHI